MAVFPGRGAVKAEEADRQNQTAGARTGESELILAVRGGAAKNKTGEGRADDPWRPA